MSFLFRYSLQNRACFAARMADTIRLLTDLLYTRLTNFATTKYLVVVKKTRQKMCALRALPCADGCRLRLRQLNGFEKVSYNFQIVHRCCQDGLGMSRTGDQMKLAVATGRLVHSLAVPGRNKSILLSVDE